MLESPKKKNRYIEQVQTFVKRDLFCLRTDTERGLHRPSGQPPRCDQAWLPSGGAEGGEFPPDQLGLHPPAAMAPDADKGFAHVTWAGAQGENGSRTPTVLDVQLRELTRPLRDSRVPFPRNPQPPDQPPTLLCMKNAMPHTHRRAFSHTCSPPATPTDMPCPLLSHRTLPTLGSFTSTSSWRLSMLPQDLPPAVTVFSSVRANHKALELERGL